MEKLKSELHNLGLSTEAEGNVITIEKKFSKALGVKVVKTFKDNQIRLYKNGNGFYSVPARITIKFKR